MNSCFMQTAVLSKAQYSDLEDIRKYLNKYHKKHNLDTEGLKDVISSVFSLGCIYILRRGSEIISLFPVKIERREWSDTRVYVLSYGGIPVLYQRPEYAPLIKNCIKIINSGIVAANGKNIAVYEIIHPDNDTYLGEIVEDMAYYGVFTEFKTDDGWTATLYNQRWARRGVAETASPDPDKDLEYFSTALERIMKLAPAKEKEKPKKYEAQKTNIALIKERRRINREIDEYDERYYRCN